MLSTDKGKLLEVVANFGDFEQAKEIQTQMERMNRLASLGSLVAGLAHEIRNPMASISGSIQMLRDGLTEKDVNSRLMDIVSREIGRLNRLVNNFLLFARPKKANFQKFDLNQVINESLELFKNSHHWTGKMKACIDFHNHIKLESDPEQIKQVLWNLFLNACEAMPDGGSFYVTTRLEPDVPQPDQKRVKIIVRDTGDGFDNKILSNAFIPFFTTKDEGSGLGLAIVKRIVEGLQGNVSAVNHAEGGAEISILFPTSPSDFPSIEST